MQLDHLMQLISTTMHRHMATHATENQLPCAKVRGEYMLHGCRGHLSPAYVVPNQGVQGRPAGTDFVLASVGLQATMLQTVHGVQHADEDADELLSAQCGTVTKHTSSLGKLTWAPHT